MVSTTEDKKKSIVDISVLVPICERYDDISEIFLKHRKVIEQNQLSYEFIFVLDGEFPDVEKKLELLLADNPKTIKILKFHRAFGEAKALNAAFKESTGKRILTIPAYFQVVPEEIQKLLDSFTDEVDVAFGARYPRRDNWLNRIQAGIFHLIINYLMKESFRDISCGVRLLNRNVMEKVALYGDLHRFIPILAEHNGFKVKEIPLKQAPEDIRLRLYRPGIYLRRLLDIFTLFFLIKFTQKPLRFFGLWGSGIGFIGLIITGITVMQRLFFENVGLSDRPLFLVGILMILLGVQTFFIGLVAEIILFMHMPTEPHYNIEKKID